MRPWRTNMEENQWQKRKVEIRDLFKVYRQNKPFDQLLVYKRVMSLDTLEDVGQGWDGGGVLFPENPTKQPAPPSSTPGAVYIYITQYELCTKTLDEVTFRPNMWLIQQNLFTRKNRYWLTSFTWSISRQSFSQPWPRLIDPHADLYAFRQLHPPLSWMLGSQGGHREVAVL